MFMVFSREKIISYLVSLGTVAILFVISFAITKKNDNIIKTSANVIESNIIKNDIIENNIFDNNTNIIDKKENNI